MSSLKSRTTPMLRLVITFVPKTNRIHIKIPKEIYMFLNTGAFFKSFFQTGLNGSRAAGGSTLRL